MKRSEIRIEAAKKRLIAAEDRLDKAHKARRAAIEVATKKHSPRVQDAERAFCAARQAVAVAELAAHGIVPMKTIILWHPKFSGVTSQRRYVVRVTREGWTRLVPVRKAGSIMEGRAEQDGPYSTEWNKVTVTNEELRSEP